MRTRLYNALDSFLIKFDISSDSRIFEDILLELSGLQPKSDGNWQYRYSISSSYKSDDILTLSIPQGLSLDELTKVCTFFKILLSSYKTGKDLPMNTDALFNDILPAFQRHIEKLNEENPEKLKFYQIASKEQLERNAIDKVKSIVNKFLDKLNQDDVLPEQYQEVSKSLFMLEGIFNGIKRNSRFYSYCVNTYNDFDKIFSNDMDLKKYLGEEDVNTLLGQLNIYIKYNSAESVICIDKFLKQSDELFCAKGIDKRECDILENILFDLADISSMPARSTYNKSRSDKSKVYFKMIGITDDIANQFQAWIKAQGDDGAKFYSHEVEESDALKHDGEHKQSYQIKEKRVYVQEYTFLIDGEVLYKKIFPLVKDKFLALSEDDTKLKSYQDASKESKILSAFLEKANEVEKTDIGKSTSMGMLIFSSGNQMPQTTALVSDTSSPSPRQAMGQG